MSREVASLTALAAELTRLRYEEMPILRDVLHYRRMHEELATVSAKLDSAIVKACRKSGDPHAWQAVGAPLLVLSRFLLFSSYQLIVPGAATAHCGH